MVVRTVRVRRGVVGMRMCVHVERAATVPVNMEVHALSQQL